jgi:hypothetical protein
MNKFNKHPLTRNYKNITHTQALKQQPTNTRNIDTRKNFEIRNYQLLTTQDYKTTNKQRTYKLITLHPTPILAHPIRISTHLEGPKDSQALENKLHKQKQSNEYQYFPPPRSMSYDFHSTTPYQQLHLQEHPIVAIMIDAWTETNTSIANHFPPLNTVTTTIVLGSSFEPTTSRKWDHSPQTHPPGSLNPLELVALQDPSFRYDQTYFDCLFMLTDGYDYRQMKSQNAYPSKGVEFCQKKRNTNNRKYTQWQSYISNNKNNIRETSKIGGGSLTQQTQNTDTLRNPHPKLLYHQLK